MHGLCDALAQNEDYPTEDTTVSEECEYKLERIQDDLCQIRLDFDVVELITSATTGDCGAATSDRISVESDFASGDNAFPTLCGLLTDQHSKGNFPF